MDHLVDAIAAKKLQLDLLRPISQAALLSLQKAYDVDLTYTSNAIEGNTLTLRWLSISNTAPRHRVPISRNAPKYSISETSSRWCMKIWNGLRSPCMEACSSVSR